MGGEPIDDVYEGRFTIDMTGPRVTHQNPAGDVGGTVDHVDVWFSEAINAETFTVDDVTITGPTGGIAPSSVTEIGINAFRITFSTQTAVGEYHIVISPDIKDAAGNLMDQDGDGLQAEPGDDLYNAVFQLVDVDLKLTSVTVNATELWAGETITVSWDGSNDSGMPLLGDWTDGVYFSMDDQWDIDDELLSTILHTGGLTQDETYSQSVSVLIPGALPGDYYVIVRADLYNQEKEGVDEGNNIVSVGPIPLYVHQLPIDGLPVSSTLNDTDWCDCYAVGVESGENLVMILSTLETDANIEFFTSYEKVPIRLDYDYRSSPVAQGYQQVAVGGTLHGTYYVLVYGDQLSDSLSYEFGANLCEIVVTSISPDRHGTSADCTMTITGSGFDATTTTSFVASDGSTWVPTETQIMSLTTMVVILDVSNWPKGLYDLIVAKESTAPYELADAFEVTTGVAQFDAYVVVPSFIGRHWHKTIWIEYANTGEASMPAPLLKLHGSDNAILTLDSSLMPTGSGTHTYPGGTSDTIQVMAHGSGATPGILQPGDSGRIPVYYLGTLWPWDIWDNTITFDLGILTANSSEVIDWVSLKDEIRPESLPPDAWEAIWANLTEQVGNTWGDYVVMLNENMNYLHTVGQDVSDVSSLLTFEIQQAQGLSSLPYLAVSVDAYLPASGMPLTFARVFGQTIDSRYELGPLGRGWSHNWDVYVQVLSDGDVVVHGLLGVDRYFTKEGDGFKASPGDYGTLTLGSSAYRLVEDNGIIWQFRSNNLLDYVEDTNGNRITAVYTAGRLTGLTHSNGDQIFLEYNANGRISRVTDPRGFGTEDDHIITFEYDATGQYLLNVTAPGDRVTTYTYETAGTPQENLALLFVVHPDAIHDYFVYDTNGRLIETHKDGGALEVTYSYDSAGMVTAVDATGRQTVLFFGLGGQLVKTVDGEGNTIGLDYDRDYELIGLIGGSGQQYHYSYDSHGNVIGIEDPVRKHTTFTYTSTYNELTSVTDAHGNCIEYVYDDAGNLISATDPNGTTTMAYDPDTDWLTRIDYPGGQYFTFVYDAAGRRTQRTDQDGNVVIYMYDIVGRLDRMTDGTGVLIVDYDYDAAGRIELKTLGNGVYTMYEYDQAGQLTHLVNYSPDNLVLSRFDYTYDASGRRTSMTTLDGTYSYGYDPLGQLTSVTYPDSRVVKYVYDPVGNRIEVIDDGVSTPYTTNGMNQYTEVGGVAYTFDADGNMISKTEASVTTTYTYDIENRLIGVTTPTDTWTYIYDAFGNRIGSTHNGVSTNYIVDPIGLGDVAAEYDSSGNVIARYDHGFGLLSRTDPLGNPAYYAFDAIGSTSEITDPAGVVLNSYSYDPFGVSLSSSETLVNPFQYVGEYGVMHETNGLDFMRARFYEPETGRFISPDPLGLAGGDVNLYEYAQNDPVNLIDPLGLNEANELSKKLIWLRSTGFRESNAGDL